METIKSYLENIFKSLPQTPEVLRIKGDLLNDMESKYHELRQQGKTENEAIGEVIAEFGNIDELLAELEIEQPGKETGKFVSLTEAKKFLSASRKAGSLTAFGVGLIIFGVSVMIGMFQFFEDVSISFLPLTAGEISPVVLLFMTIIPAVALFIYSGTLTEGFKFIDEGHFFIDSSAKATLTDEYSSLLPRKNGFVIGGVTLILVGVVFIIVLTTLTDKTYGVSLALLLIAVAVMGFIYSDSLIEPYEKLLKIGEFTPVGKKSSRVIGVVASIVFPLATCIFLVWGLAFDGWHINWIVYVVTGILFGCFSSAYKAAKGKEE